MTKYTVYQALPIELFDDAPALAAYQEHLAERLAEQVTDLGHNVTSEVTFNVPSSFWATYFDLDGEYHQAPLTSRHPDLKQFPCHKCRVTWGRCVTISGRRVSYFHQARNVNVTAGCTAWADTDYDLAAATS